MKTQSAAELTYLVNDIVNQDSEIAYRQLFALLYPPLRNFAYYYVKSTEQAEEVAADVLIAIWRKRALLNQIKNLRVYAFVMAKNHCLNILRQHKPGQVIALDSILIDLKIDDTTPEQLLINDELGRKLNAAIDTLPQRCKMIFKLVKEDGLSYKEVAEIMDISIKTVDGQLVIALKKLTAVIGKEFNLSIGKKI